MNWWFYNTKSHHIIETLWQDGIPKIEVAACGEELAYSMYTPREPYCELCRRWELLAELGK